MAKYRGYYDDNGNEHDYGEDNGTANTEARKVGMTILPSIGSAR